MNTRTIDKAMSKLGGATTSRRTTDAGNPKELAKYLHTWANSGSLASELVQEQLRKFGVTDRRMAISMLSDAKKAA